MSHPIYHKSFSRAKGELLKREKIGKFMFGKNFDVI